MKLENAISKLLANKIVLYVVFVISIFNIIGYLTFGNTTALVYFIILALLVSYFSKNMILILLVPLILVNLYVASQNQLKNVEGMENTSDESDASSSANANAPPAATSTASASQSSSDESATDLATQPQGNESFKNSKNNHKLDYSGTLSETYSNLNSLLGQEGMAALTNDTKQLMEQQKQLAESMQGLQPLISSFAPLVKQAQGLMSGLGNSGGNIKGLEGLSDIVKQMGGGAAPQ